MKKLLLLLFATIFITSCSINEQVYVNEDQSINYGFNIGTESIPLLMGVSKKNDELDFPIDSIMTVEEFSKSEFSGNKGGDDPKKDDFIKIFKDFKVHTKISDDDGFIRFFTQQKNVKKLNGVMNDLEKNIQKQMEKEKGDEDSELFSKAISTPNFSYNGKKFTRKDVMDLTEMKEKINEKGNDFGRMGMMSSLFSYSLEYHFPRPVKSISDTTVLMSWDRKTIYLKKSMTELINNENALNFEVELED